MEIEPTQAWQPIEATLDTSPTIITIEDYGKKLTVHQAPSLGKVSDGYHTFDELYQHRCLLFAALIAANSEGFRAWKSRQHEDGGMFAGWFIAGLTLPLNDSTASAGSITYHVPIAMWDLFDCIELDTAPHWDGHTPTDVVARLTSWLTGSLDNPAIDEQEF